MPPVLRVISGDQPEQQTVLENPRTVLGRAEDSDIVIAEADASRQHAAISNHHGTYQLSDLGSRNGTRLNGIAVKQPTPLRHGDVVTIGTTEFEFQMALTNAAGAPQNTQDEPNVSNIVTRMNALQTPQEISRISPETTLQGILDLTRAVGATLDLDQLAPKLVQCFLTLFPKAERACLILCHDDGTPVAHTAQHQGGPVISGDFTFSRTVVQTSIASKQAILSGDIAGDERFSASQTAATVRWRMVMCAPLLSQVTSEVIGVIQVDADTEGDNLDSTDLHILTSLASIASIAAENSQMHSKVVQQHQLDQELEFAQDIQRGFMPMTMPEFSGYECWAFYEAAGHVGGDYYDIFELPDGNIAAIVADVAGKGVPAALLMAKFSSETRSALNHYPNDAAQALNAINKSLCATGLKGRFVTVVLCILNRDTHKVAMASAGHMSPVVRRRDGSIDLPIGEDVNGVPIGIMANWAYKSTTTQLEPDECLVMVTDGVTEALDNTESMYGDPRLIDGIQQSDCGAKTVGDTLLADLRAHMSNCAQYDDIAMVVVGRRAEK